MGDRLNVRDDRGDSMELIVDNFDRVRDYVSLDRELNCLDFFGKKKKSEEKISDRIITIIDWDEWHHIQEK